FLFFSLFSVVGRTSAIIGPFVSEAIISASGTITTCRSRFCLDSFSTVFIFMVDVEKSQVECEEFVAAEIGHDVSA
ncbi:hypothetical protein BJV77DRAFT_989669, partial [Russula vinacea]